MKPSQKTVLITGAAGNLGAKLRAHLEGRYTLRLLDREPRGDDSILGATLSDWSPEWVKAFSGVDVVIHLAADPTAHQAWPKLVGPNIDGIVNVFMAAIQAGVSRVVFASSNHVMSGYSTDSNCRRLATDSPPKPGTQYIADGERRDSTAYAATKLFGERVGKCFADAYGLSVIAVRLGRANPGRNGPLDAYSEQGQWWHLMWLSNRDFCNLMERCILSTEPKGFAVIHGMSANSGMVWDLESTQQLVGFEPQDNIMRSGDLQSNIPLQSVADVLSLATDSHAPRSTAGGGA